MPLSSNCRADRPAKIEQRHEKVAYQCAEREPPMTWVLSLCSLVAAPLPASFTDESGVTYG